MTFCQYLIADIDYECINFRQTQTEEQQLSIHDQHRSDSQEDKGEENNVPTSDV